MMADAPMTTYMVHRIIQQRDKTKQCLRKNTKLHLTINYETYPCATIAYPKQSLLSNKIKKQHFNHKNSFIHTSCKNVNAQSIDNNFHNTSTLFNPYKLALQLQCNLQPQRTAGRVNKAVSNFTITHENMFANNEKDKHRKIKRPKSKRKSNNFGLNIKQIDYHHFINDDTSELQQCKKSSKNSPKILNKLIGLKNRINNNQEIKIIDISKEQNLSPKLQNNNKIISPRINEQILKCKTQKSNKLVKIITMYKQKNINDKKSIKNKLHKMFLSMSIILYSFNCYFDLQLSNMNNKKIPKYTYYIGKGNNQNLLITLMKKRWWWTQTDDINSANFIWTQLKVKNIIKKQSEITIEKYSLLTQINQKQQLNSQQPTYKYNKKFIQKHSSKLQYLSKILHQNYPYKYLIFLLHNNLIRHKQLQKINTPQIIHNHFSRNYIIGNKSALFHHLVYYYDYCGKNIFNIIPKTYYIEQNNQKKIKQFSNLVQHQKNVIWIVKPGENSNRGKGIFISDNIEHIIGTIKKNFKKHSYIVQKYIKNSLLFQNRKFDIRVYLLMVTIKGIIKYFWYNEGYLRTSSQKYDLSDLSDNFIHLTNDAIQINSDKYSKFELGNKISYNDFQKYLDKTYLKQKYQIQELNKLMKNISIEIIKGTYNKINMKNNIQNNFELFGLDFIIDKQFKPWLIQINTNPCLELSSPCLERLIPRMLENMFRLVLDPLFQPHFQPPRSLSHYIYDNMLENNKFQLIFDTQFDRDLKWQQYCQFNHKQSCVFVENNQSIFHHDEQDIQY